MRFATYTYEGRRHCGALADDRLHPLPDGADLLDLIRSGAEALHAAGRAALAGPPGPAVGEVRLLPPIQPPTVRDFMAFEEHVEGVRRAVTGAAGVPEQWYAAPAFYFGNPYAVIGAHDGVPVPPGSQALDFELEVAAVIGREGGDLTPGQAREHIIGYTILNDWSARDLQAAEMQVGLGPCKGKDTATTLGPWLVTADELEPYRDGDGFLRLALTASVNGTVVGTDLLSNMGWTFEDLVAYASRGTVVRPGDVLGSGTMGNGGCLAELWGRNGRREPAPLKVGDTVVLTVEGLGSTANTVVPGAAPQPVPAARPRPRTRP
ncbi:fumarylacetoacetate hydrolase family protein [Kitasatospora cineracea]|uniref:fumarylacetoacetate hydrolase family protein n=1 Tax=Kitasatospora cineracea TaxID=88074 RepID=UPI00380AC69C